MVKEWFIICSLTFEMTDQIIYAALIFSGGKQMFHLRVSKWFSHGFFRNFVRGGEENYSRTVKDWILRKKALENLVPLRCSKRPKVKKNIGGERETKKFKNVGNCLGKDRFSTFVFSIRKWNKHLLILNCLLVDDCAHNFKLGYWMRLKNYFCFSGKILPV